jgi:hypothetical protein
MWFAKGHHILRVIVTRYLCQHRVEFEGYIDREQFQSWEEFITKISREGTFVDGLVVGVAAITLHAQIIVKIFITIEHGKKSADDLFFGSRKKI